MHVLVRASANVVVNIVVTINSYATADVCTQVVFCPRLCGRLCLNVRVRSLGFVSVLSYGLVSVGFIWCGHLCVACGVLALFGGVSSVCAQERCFVCVCLRGV